MRKINRLSILSILFLCLFSCSKNDKKVSTPSYSSIDEVFSKLSLKPKIITVDASLGGSFLGNSGTRYIFYGYSFIDASGATVTGAVDIEVTEYLQKGDMIFSKMLPVSNGLALISGGEINAVGSQNGAPIYLRKRNCFKANIPQEGDAPTDMKFFSGQSVIDTTLMKTNWLPVVLDSSRYWANVILIPGNGGVDTLSIISDSLKLVNADKFYGNANLQNFNVKISANDVELSTTNRVDVFVLYDGIKTAMPIYHSSAGYLNYDVSNISNVNIHFIAFTVVRGKFYGGLLPAVPVTGASYNIILSEIDPVVFKAKLNAL